MSMQSPFFEGVLNIYPLANLVGTRSTGCREPENRRDGETAKTRSQRGDPPSANWRTKTPKTCVFLGDFDPFRHFSCLAEGGGPCIICYTGRVFWPSANELPWRKRVVVRKPYRTGGTEKDKTAKPKFYRCLPAG